MSSQKFKVRDAGLAPKGWNNLRWAEEHMPVLMRIKKDLAQQQPLAGIRVSAVLHVTKETGVLVTTLQSLGAEVWLAGSNPLSTQDDIAAALVEEGIHVFAWRGETSTEYYETMKTILNVGPNIIMDDGGDLHALAHEEYQGLKITGGTEETTTGVVRIKSMEKQGVLRYPVIAVNNAYTKFMFDNRFGTGQSAIDGILRATNILLAGKVVVVAGFGWVGRGIAYRLRGMGARVIVTEVDPIRALEAVMDGFEVMNMEKASEIGDIFITATGNISIISLSHIKKLKDGAILANAGHFDVEVDMRSIKEYAKERRTVRDNLDMFIMPSGKRIYVIGEGRLVNLVAAEGHPSEVMDMSFANQALSVIRLAKEKLEPKVYDVPKDIDDKVALLKLQSMGISIDKQTEEQARYSQEWKSGT